MAFETIPLPGKFQSAGHIHWNDHGSYIQRTDRCIPLCLPFDGTRENIATKETITNREKVKHQCNEQ